MAFHKKNFLFLKNFFFFFLYIIELAKVFLEHPELGKACRAIMEWLNKRAKAPFKASLNRQGLDHIVNRIELQLGGEVRNFIN